MPRSTHPSRRHAGWSILEVAIASSIGAIALGTAVTMVSTGVTSTAQVTKSGKENRRSTETHFDIRQELAQAVLDRVQINTLPSGSDMVTFQIMVEREGEDDAGVMWTLPERVVDPAWLMDIADPDNQVPLAGKEHELGSPHHDHWFRYTVITDEDGTQTLFKLILDKDLELEGAGVIAENVSSFKIARTGDGIEFKLVTIVDKKERIVWDSFVLPKN